MGRSSRSWAIRAYMAAVMPLAEGGPYFEYPVYTSQKADAMTAGLKPVYFGNWYLVAQREIPRSISYLIHIRTRILDNMCLWMSLRTVFKVLQPDAVGYLQMHT